MVALLIISLIGSAAAYDEEITFQNIPWCSSIEEVKTILNELYGEFDCNQFDGSGSYILNSDGGYFSDWYSYEGQTVTLLIQPKDIEMLGYPLESIRFVFATDGEESKLITIALRPKAPDLSGKTFDKMVGTFVDDTIGQYGKPKKNDSSQFILCGGENTAIYMYKGRDEFMWFGRTDASTIIESMIK